jgi:hypothetical protein
VSWIFLEHKSDLAATLPPGFSSSTRQLQERGVSDLCTLSAASSFASASVGQRWEGEDRGGARCLSFPLSHSCSCVPSGTPEGESGPCLSSPFARPPVVLGTLVVCSTLRPSSHGLLLCLLPVRIPAQDFTARFQAPLCLQTPLCQTGPHSRGQWTCVLGAPFSPLRQPW